MVLMKIRRVIPDAESYTLHVPLYILPGLNADQLIAKEVRVSGKGITLTENPVNA